MFISILKSLIYFRFAVSISCFSSGILQKYFYHLLYLCILKEVAKWANLILKDFLFCGYCFDVGSKCDFKPQQI